MKCARVEGCHWLSVVAAHTHFHCYTSKMVVNDVKYNPFMRPTFPSAHLSTISCMLASRINCSSVNAVQWSTVLCTTIGSCWRKQVFWVSFQSLVRLASNEKVYKISSFWRWIKSLMSNVLPPHLQAWSDRGFFLEDPRIMSTTDEHHRRIYPEIN